MKQLIRNTDPGSLVKSWALVLGGTFLYVLSLNLFLVPNNIAAGGLSGLAIVLKQFVPLGVGTLIYIMNAPILLTAVFVNGWAYTIGTIIVATLYSAAIEALNFLPAWTDDPLVASISGGVIYGVGMAMITMGRGSTGGTDLMSRLLLKAFPRMSIGRMSLVIDGTVVLLAVISFRNVEAGLYAIFTLYICSTVCDHILMGYASGRLCMIFTQKAPHEIADPLMKATGRAVTRMEGTGMFTDTSRNILLMAVRPAEVIDLKTILYGIDPDAFVVLVPVTELIGGHFQGRPRA